MESMVTYKDLFEGAYFGKRVLVTGHTGFKGSWLIHWLYLMGADVYGYSLSPHTEPNHFMWAPPIQSVFGDIRDPENIEKTFERAQPEIVFHLAAQALVRESYSNPVDTFSSNVMGTLHVLEACRKTASVKAIVVISSDKCYDNKEWVWGYRETEAMGGYDPYSASKGCTELLVSSYRNSYFNIHDYGIKHSVLLSSARAGNVIGGGDWATDRLIPDMVKAASIQNSVFIRNRLATRPWQHVLEPLSGYLTLGWQLLKGTKEYADGWNFGPSHESNLTVDEIVTLAINEWNAIRVEYSQNKADAHEANLLMLDCSKANKILKWNAIWDIHKTIHQTISWYMHFYTNHSIQTQHDIEQFISDARKMNAIWTI